MLMFREMNMHKIFRWFNFKAAIFSITLIGILILGNFWCFPANANPLNVAKISGIQIYLPIAKLPTLEEIQNSLTSFAEETQASLEKNIEETNEALTNLPGQLEESIVRMNAADREKTRQAYAQAQKKLQASAQAYEERAAQAEQFEQELLKSAEETRNSIQADFQASKADLEDKIKRDIANLKQSFKATSEAYDILAEDTKIANEEASEFLKQRIEQHTAALEQAMKKSNESLKALFNQA